MRSARVDGQGPTLGLLDHFKHFRIDRVEYFADQATAMAWQRFYWCVFLSVCQQNNADA